MGAAARGSSAESKDAARARAEGAAGRVKLIVVGGGRMGGALLGGLVASGWAKPSELAVVEPEAERRDALAADLEGLVTLRAPSAGVLAPDGWALLAVKPDVAEEAARSLAAAGITRVLSIVAGLTTARLERLLEARAVVVRAMPNTPTLVGAGAAAVAGGRHAGAEDLEWARSLLAAVGTVIVVAEEDLDAVTGVSGSGPAYVFFMADALIEAGVAAGLAPEVSRALVVQTLTGSAKMLLETGEDPEVLRAMVTSPGGTTEAGIDALDRAAVRAAFVRAVGAATARSRELGG